MLTSLLIGVIAAAGQAAATPARSAAPAPAAQMAQQVESPAGYSYAPEGRRDPFVSLVGRGSDDTLFALSAGHVLFGARRGRKTVNIVPIEN